MTQVNVRMCCCVESSGRVVSSSVRQITYDSYEHISVCVCVLTPSTRLVITSVFVHHNDHMRLIKHHMSLVKSSQVPAHEIHVCAHKKKSIQAIVGQFLLKMLNYLI